MPTPAQLAADSAPPKPLSLQLIGIVHDPTIHDPTAQGSLGGESGPAAGWKAALYDMESDQLHIVASGEKIRQLTVTQVTASDVVLSDGRTTRRLALMEHGS